MTSSSRNLEPTMVCVKYLILAFNCMLVMTGMLLVAIGSTISGFFNSFDELLSNEYVTPAQFLIAVGVIVFFVALFGCIGAIKESVCWMNIYTACLVVIFVFELSAGFAGFAMQSSIEESLTTRMMKAIQIDYVQSTEMNTTIDYIQQQLECCGANGPMDWDGVLSADVDDEIGWMEGDVIVPHSCCGSYTTTNETWTCDQPFNDGCLPTLKDIAKSGAVLFTTAAITVAICQAIGIFFSNALAKAIRRAKSLRVLRQQEIRHRVLDSYTPMSKTVDQNPAPVLYLAGGEGHDTSA